MITIEFLIPVGELDLSEFGPTAVHEGDEIADSDDGVTLVSVVTEQAEWVRYDGDTVTARFAGTDEDVCLSSEDGVHKHAWQVRP